MESSTDSLLSVTIFQVSNQACLVILSVSTGWANAVHCLHMLDELVGNLKDLLTVIAGQKLASGLVLTDVNAQVELLAEGHLASLTPEPIVAAAHVFVSRMIPDQG